MNSAINELCAAQQQADAVREARRASRLPGAPLPSGESGRPGLVARLTRRVARPHSLRPAPSRP